MRPVHPQTTDFQINFHTIKYRWLGMKESKGNNEEDI